MVRWVFGSIPHGGLIELFSFQPVLQWHVISRLRDGACKISLSANRNTGPDSAVAMPSANGFVGTGFASRYRLQSRAGF